MNKNYKMKIINNNEILKHYRDKCKNYKSIIQMIIVKN